MILRPGEFAVRAGTAIAGLGAVTALLNRITLRQLRGGSTTVTEAVTVCVPARNEADRLPGLIADLRAQQGIPQLRVLILDDDSTDDTSSAALAAVGVDERFTVQRNEIAPAPGWTGKNAACALLAELATVQAPGALVFLDADVRLAPGAVAAAVAELRRAQASSLCAWPRQRARTATERLVQPLLCWSWAGTLPLILGNRSLRPSTAVACGQFLVFDAADYGALGGHAVVADRITEDLAIARALRRSGRRTVLVAGGQLAETRMYRDAKELEQGYSRWLWTAYGGPAGSVAVAALLALGYWVPPLAALTGRGRTRRLGLLGYAAAVTGRLLARSTESGGSLTPTDALAALAHPVAIAAYLRLSAKSHLAHRRGTLSWKDRALNNTR
ncbi:glycosyltransferase family 2 protein [Nocardia sp. NBC_01388]|uniref:glycosyltransferase family 2 protein n=1 Tax=Nocardia sp. NBC_01388 TaxID=2903596 RepID=UPI003248B07B